MDRILLSRLHIVFRVRKDVYAIRWENARSGKSRWTPTVERGWRKGSKAADQRL